ncbi:Uncharacterized protein TCM_009188 [Theobroma cacao]|uniref:RNase H type-1 domain-containing protein n=1 Tax=Theobroma cacao TaxID=3641 RepID=A0A061E4T6_THECC|nr:Uncharacterized protein TCM_009188 [Theobroma cacao]
MARVLGCDKVGIRASGLVESKDSRVCQRSCSSSCRVLSLDCGFGGAPVAHAMSRSNDSQNALHSTSKGLLDSTTKSQWCPDPESQESGHLPKIISWHKPSIGEFKLNVDGSSINNFQNAGGGGLLRDHTGTLVFAFSENLEAKNSLQAELLALHSGLLLCQENNISRLWTEMEAMIVIQMLKEGHIGSHDSRYLWASIRQQLKLFSFKISHIHRKGNQATNWLANHGHQHHGLQVLKEAQGKLRGILTLDKSNLPYVRLK